MQFGSYNGRSLEYRFDLMRSYDTLRLRGGASPAETNGPFTQRAAGLFQKFQMLQSSVEAKRLELCPWEQFGIECEEAFAYQQVNLRLPITNKISGFHFSSHDRPGFVLRKDGTDYSMLLMQSLADRKAAPLFRTKLIGR